MAGSLACLAVEVLVEGVFCFAPVGLGVTEDFLALAEKADLAAEVCLVTFKSWLVFQ